MNKKQRKTLALLFTVPTVASLKFADIERLLIALGAEVIEGRGSRLAFVMKSGLKWEAHRPHPQKEAKKYQVESVRRFLITIGYGNE